MAGIDYSKYLEGLGAVDTNQEKAIREYLEKQCEQDEALKSLYNPEKIHDCYEFIKNCVEKMQRTGECACIDSAVVFKMARDYFIEILPTIAENPPEVKTEEKPIDISESMAAEEMSATATIEEINNLKDEDAAKDDVKRDEYGFEVFGEDADEPEEEAAEEPCNQEEVGETEEEKVLQPVASDTPMYDEEGNGLLFGF